MGLGILILVCLLTVAAAKPSHRDAIAASTLDLLSCKSSDVSPTDGHAHLLDDCSEDRMWSSPLLSNRDENENEDDLQVPAFAIPQAGEINLAIALFFPASPSPLAAHFSSWCTPLRC
jgi:hypothetical protein